MAKGAGGGGRTAGRGGAVSNLARMMPAQNRKVLGIASGEGLPSVEKIPGQLAYNPKTNTLVAGAGHAVIIADYAPGQRYDDFVKAYFWPVRGGAGWQLYIDVDRIAGRDNAAKWDAAFQTARAFRSAGLPGNVSVRLDFGKTETLMDLDKV